MITFDPPPRDGGGSYDGQNNELLLTILGDQRSEYSYIYSYASAASKYLLLTIM